MCHYTDDCF
jgi:hypothetical protein